MKSACLCARLAALSLALCTVFPALAQSEAVGTLKEVIVTATRNPQPLGQVVADVSVISHEQILEMGAQTVLDVLALLPGVQATAALNAVFIRGAESRMTAVMIDGVRVDTQHDNSSATGGGANWNLIPLSQIERIEVLRGPSSSIYGSDAMGGVVQIFTKRGTGPLRASLALGVGSNNLVHSNVTLAGGQGAWSYAFGAGTESSNGYNTAPTVIHTPDTEGYSQSNASASLGFQMDSNHRLEASVTRSQKSNSYVGYNGAPPLYLGGPDQNASSGLTTYGLRWQADWTDVYSTTLSSSQSLYNHQNANALYATTLRTVMLDNQFRLFDSALVNAVLEHKDDFIDSSYSDSFNAAYSGGRTQDAVGLGYGDRRGASSWQINVRQDRDASFGVRNTGSAAFAYNLTPAWRASVSSGLGFRAPSLEQLHSAYGSTSLQPEQSRNTEAVIGYSDGERSVKLLTYRTVFDNLISATGFSYSPLCSANQFCYYNVGRASVTGQTLSAEQKLGKWDLHASADWLNPRNDDTGLLLNLRARNTINVGVNHALDGWRWGVKVTSVGERYNNATNTQLLPSYLVIGAHLQRQITPEWQWLLRVDNATDTQYQQYSNYAAPGVTVYSSLQWTPKP